MTNNLVSKKTASTSRLIPSSPEIIWLSISEAAKIAGVNTKTIRRALKKNLKFKIQKERYLIDCSALLVYVRSNKKLLNKFYEHGAGKFLEFRN